MWKKLAIFGLIALILSAVAIPLLFFVKFGDNTLLGVSSRSPVRPGGMGYSLQRFRDIENYHDVDVVFLGSSHCYRTYDPRVFAEYGLSAFNMGSTGQTPLNGYFLLKRYYDQLQPKLVVIDLVYRVMDRDGLESFYELSANLSYSYEFAEMAMAVGSPHAYQQLANMWMRDHFGEGPPTRQRHRDGEAYIPGGLVTYTKPDPLHEDPAQEVVHGSQTIYPKKMQLDYVAKMVELVRAHGGKVVLVTKPEPRGNLTAITNYPEVSRQFAEFAEQIGVRFIDFNQRDLPLNFREHFQKREYLSAKGQAVFNPILIETLAEYGYFFEMPDFAAPSPEKNDGEFQKGADSLR